MAKTEPIASRAVQRSSGRSVYDGFISYSHAADDLLAPRLQAGLQRFAKPWWKRRALRIFRDESSLSANPHLWASITEALDTSEWFILLLSPDAARSPWVNQEIQYWRRHQDPDRILPVLTDGEFTWNGTDVSGDATPEELRGAYAEEPRWVDLRFAREEEQLDLKNPRFASAMADIASAIRGVPKDELESEEVRQHRRTVRTAWSAGLALVALAFAAVGFGVQSANNATEAERQTQLARESASEAETHRQQAEENATEAEANADEAYRQRLEAETQAALARSRELAAAAASVQQEDPELAMLLAMASLQAAPSEDASAASVIALRKSLLNNRLTRRFPVGDSFRLARLSPDGNTIYHASERDRSLTAIDVQSGEIVWEYHDPTTVDSFRNVGVSPDGQVVALAVADVPVIQDPLVEVNEEGHDAHPARVVILKASDGRVERIMATGDCPVSRFALNGFSPNGTLMAINTGTDRCDDFAESDWIDLYDTSSWTKIGELKIEGMHEQIAVFSEDGTRVLVAGHGARAELLSYPELEQIRVFEGVWTNINVDRALLSPDGLKVVLWGGGGSTVELRPLLLDAETGDRIAYLDVVNDFPGTEGLAFSADGSKIAVTTRSRDYVFDADTGRLITSLGEAGVTFSSSFSSDGTKLVTATPFDLLLWDLASSGHDVGQTIDPAGAEPVWINPDAGREGPRVALWTLVPEPTSSTGFAGYTSVIDPVSGIVAFEISGMSVQLPDGRFVVSPYLPLENEEDMLRLPLTIWDPVTDEKTRLTECTLRDSQVDFETPVECEEGDQFFGAQFTSISPPFTVSPDGAFIAAVSYADPESDITVRVWETASLAIRSEFKVPHHSGCADLIGSGDSWIAFREWCVDSAIEIYDIDSGAQVTTLSLEVIPFLEPMKYDPVSNLVFIHGGIAEVYVVDTTTWEVVTRWDAHKANLRGLALSPDGNRLVTTGEDNFANIWDVSGVRQLEAGQPPPLLDAIPAPKPSDALWIGPDRLGLLLADGAKWYPVSLAVGDLTAEAQNRLTRGFTPIECATYNIDPCPTLEDLRDE